MGKVDRRIKRNSDKAKRLRREAKKPKYQVKFYWQLYKDWPYALQRLWLYCAKNGFQMPDKQMKEFAAWVKNEHETYTGKYKINPNRKSNVAAMEKWLNHYSNGASFSKDDLDAFIEWITDIVGHLDTKRGNGERKRENHRTNKHILYMYDQYLEQGFSKTQAKDEIEKQSESLFGIKLTSEAIGKRLKRYLEKQMEIFQEGGRPDLP